MKKYQIKQHVKFALPVALFLALSACNHAQPSVEHTQMTAHERAQQSISQTEAQSSSLMTTTSPGVPPFHRK